MLTRRPTRAPDGVGPDRRDAVRPDCCRRYRPARTDTRHLRVLVGSGSRPRRSYSPREARAVPRETRCCSQPPTAVSEATVTRRPPTTPTGARKPARTARPRRSSTETLSVGTVPTARRTTERSVRETVTAGSSRRAGARTRRRAEREPPLVRNESSRSRRRRSAVVPRWVSRQGLVCDVRSLDDPRDGADRTPTYRVVRATAISGRCRLSAPASGSVQMSL
jgi:hypothetical protein